MSEVSTDKKLKGKDLITIGIFSAIYFVINFAFMLLGGIHPVLWMLMPGFIAVFAGIPFIFSELYNVPVKIKKDYFKIKVLELLLYLDALELSGHTEERPYFYKGQVEKIKAIQSLLTQDLTKNYTLEELSAKFDIALTPMKNCFKSVYGSPIFTYMRNYRMNYAAALLKSDKSLKVADVAGLVGYDSPSKFTAAFHQTMGKTPLEYRKSII